MDAAEREHALWAASGQYIRGEISSERLGQIELSSDLDRKAATFAVIAHSMRRFLVISITCLFILWIMGSLLLYIIIGHFWTVIFVTSAIFSPIFFAVFSPILRYYFPRAQTHRRNQRD